MRSARKGGGEDAGAKGRGKGTSKNGRLFPRFSFLFTFKNPCLLRSRVLYFDLSFVPFLIIACDTKEKGGGAESTWGAAQFIALSSKKRFKERGKQVSQLTRGKKREKKLDQNDGTLLSASPAPPGGCRGPPPGGPGPARPGRQHAHGRGPRRGVYEGEREGEVFLPLLFLIFFFVAIDRSQDDGRATSALRGALRKLLFCARFRCLRTF